MSDTHALTGPFDTVLVANRGEIALRVIRTVHRMGLKAVAVYSEADCAAPHVHAADKAVCLGPAAAAESYLNIDKVIDAAKATGAGAIHPGYGFLSENATFAKRCEDEGIIFIGPPAGAIDKMGDKITARATVESRDVPTVPGISRPNLTDQEIIDAADSVGFPVLIKPSAGGGGKGMHLVEEPEKLASALVSARREAASSFGDDTLFLEHFVDTPRHIEVQIVADSHGNVIHLGERECSLQRRHQKVIEEAPSALLDEKTRQEIGEAACDAARACGYCGAGTVEFIVSAKQPERFFFMEMNTRLQVEHPVTEMVTGRDLVEWQIRVARGEALPITQDDVQLNGHSVEARVYAEDAAAGFLPTGGLITGLSWPRGEGIRVDAGVVEGQEVSSDYDPMLAKIITHADTREAALERLDQALSHTRIEGLTTNIDFNRFLVTRPEVVAGDLHTGLLDSIVEEFQPREVPADTFAVALLHLAGALAGGAEGASETTTSASPLGSAWTARDGWRGAGHRAPLRLVLADPSGVTAPVEARAEYSNGSWEVQLTPLTSGDDEDAPVQPETRRIQVVANPQSSATEWRLSFDGGPAERWSATVNGSITGPHGTHVVEVFSGTANDAEASSEESPDILSPMPGTVIAVEVADGDDVTEGQPVIVIEAMKMEHTLEATCDGRVKIHAAVGQKVGTGEVLAEVIAADSADTADG